MSEWTAKLVGGPLDGQTRSVQGQPAPSVSVLRGFGFSGRETGEYVECSPQPEGEPAKVLVWKGWSS